MDPMYAVMQQNEIFRLINFVVFYTNVSTMNFLLYVYVYMEILKISLLRSYLNQGSISLSLTVSKLERCRHKFSLFLWGVLFCLAKLKILPPH